MLGAELQYVYRMQYSKPKDRSLQLLVHRSYASYPDIAGYL
jgi:hypothetical protein